MYQKSTDDNIFFMAGAISYNLLIAVVPLFLLAVGLGVTSFVPGTASPPK